MTNTQRTQLFNKALTQELKQQRARVNQVRESLFGVLDIIQEQMIVLLAKQPSDYQQWFLPQIMTQVETVLQSLQSQGSHLLNNGLDDSASAGLAQLDNALRPAGVSLMGVSPVLNSQQLVNIKAFHVDRIKDITRTAASKIELELSKVLIGAQSPYDATKAIQTIMSDSPSYRIQSIVRTSMANVYDKSAQDRYTQAADYLPGLEKRWHRSGKRNPRASHYAAHLQTVPIDQPFIVGGVKMMHPHDPSAPVKEIVNCGCSMRPHMRTWDVKAPAQRVDTAV